MTKSTFAELEKKVLELEEENRMLRDKEAALSAKEAKYRFLADNVTDILFLQDMDLNITYFSPSAISHFGYSPEEIMTLTLQDVMTAESWERAIDNYQRSVSLAEKDRTLIVPLMEYEYVRKDGSTFWGELKVSFLYDAEGRPAGVQGILRDIDARKTVERALRESEAKFRNLFDLSPQAICLINVEIGVLVDVNDEFCKFSGFRKKELLGFPVTTLGLCSEEEWLRILEDLMKFGEIRGRETIIKQKSGEKRTAHLFTRVIHHSGHPFVLAVLYDTTEKLQLEAQLMRAKKMEAIGNLAGGIAHDFNNLLMAIQGNTSVMLFNVEPVHPNYQMLKNIEKQVQSGVGLTRQILGYARKGQYEVLPLDFNRLLEESAESFCRTRKEVRTHINLSSNLYAVEADQGQLEQIFLNLFINAADAMAGGGDLFIETNNATHLDMKCTPYSPKPGNYIRFVVRDTGTGMNEKTRKHIFDPFFTTKEMGRGTGLGLASVYGIVKGHGGYIDVESKEGKGTAFSLYFPASSNKIAASPVAANPPVDGTGTILLVDDEDRVLNITAKLIQRLGYRVIEARGGREAVELYRKHEGQVDIVILDMIMPDLNGAMTFDILKEIDPNVTVLLSSGYSLEGQAEEILKKGCDGFIQKPFSPQAISRKLNELLVLQKNN